MKTGRFLALSGGFGLLLFLISQLPGGVEAQTLSSQPLPGGFPTARRDSLLNGLLLMAVESPGSQKVRTHLRINSGAMFDLAGKGGLADLTAGMLLRGGGGLAAKNVEEFVNQSGLAVNVTVSWDSTDIVISGPEDSFDQIMELLGRLVISPSFDEKELEILRSIRAGALKTSLAEEAQMLKLKKDELVFGSHPFGRPYRGTAESVGRITKADLLYFHSRFYMANNAALIVTGDITAERLVQAARAKLGQWKKGETVPASFRPPSLNNTRRIVLLDKTGGRARLALGQIAISRRDPDYYAVLIMSRILGSMTNKSVAAIDRGISTSVSLDPRILAGPLTIEIEAPPNLAVQSIESVAAVMGRLKEGQISGADLEGAKQQIISEFSARVLTEEGASGALLDIELYGLGRDYLLKFADWINAVTSAEVQRAAQKHLAPQSLSIAVSAPASEVETKLKTVGTVTVIKLAA